VRRHAGADRALPNRPFTPGSIRYAAAGLEALQDRQGQARARLEPHPRTRSARRSSQHALEQSELSPAREVAVSFTDREANLHLGSQCLSAAEGRGASSPAPAFIVMESPPTPSPIPPNRAQSALADRLHLPQGHRLGLVLPLQPWLDDLLALPSSPGSCVPPMAAADVTDTLDRALAGFGACINCPSTQRPASCSATTGHPYVASDLCRMARRTRHAAQHAEKPYHPMTQGQDRTLAPLIEEPASCSKTIICRVSSRARH